MSNKTTNILITGAAGSGGSYMLEHLVASSPHKNYFALVRNNSSLNTNNLSKILNSVEIVYCDLQNFESVRTTLEKVNPDQIYHFASNADVHFSFKEPIEVLSNNIASTLNLFEACRNLQIKPKILLCSTSEVYGQVAAHEVPIKETNQLRPASPYAVSKTTQDLMADVYFKAYSIPIVRTRMFTYINPRRNNLFATAFALQVAKIEAGLQSELLHGNLDSVRTHIDVRDVTAAYAEVMEKGLPGEVYNLGGTTPFTVGEFLKILIKKSKVEIKCVTDPSLLRPVDVTLQIPDVSKFESLTSWRPKYKLEESVDLLLAECRSKIASERIV